MARWSDTLNPRIDAPHAQIVGREVTTEPRIEHQYLKEGSLQTYKRNYLANTTIYKGIALKVVEASETETEGVLGTVSDAFSAKQHLKVRVRIPELHAHIPDPCATNGEELKRAIVEMHPVFTSLTSLGPKQVPAFGTIVRVSFNKGPSQGVQSEGIYHGVYRPTMGAPEHDGGCREACAADATTAPAPMPTVAQPDAPPTSTGNPSAPRSPFNSSDPESSGGAFVSAGLPTSEEVIVPDDAPPVQSAPIPATPPSRGPVRDVFEQQEAVGNTSQVPEDWRNVIPQDGRRWTQPGAGPVIPANDVGASNTYRRHMDINQLLPALHAPVLRIIQGMNAAGYDAYVIEAIRSFPRARALANEGVGISRSVHCYGGAVDIVSRSQLWNVSADFWNTLVDLAQAEGFQCGHFFGMVDSAHIQAVHTRQNILGGVESEQTVFRNMDEGANTDAARNNYAARCLEARAAEYAQSQQQLATTTNDPGGGA